MNLNSITLFSVGTEDGGSKLFLNVINYMPIDTAVYSKRCEYS